MTNFSNQSQFVMGRDVNWDALTHQLFAFLNCRQHISVALWQVAKAYRGAAPCLGSCAPPADVASYSLS